MNTVDTTSEGRGRTQDDATIGPIAPHHCPTCGWGSETGGDCPRGHGAMAALEGAEARVQAKGV